MTVISFGGRLVGDEQPTLLIAEVGANHDGSIAVAHDLVDAAADAGADAVKFQTYTTAELLADADRVISWGPPGNEREEAVGAMFDRLSLPRHVHAELFAHASDRGLLAFSTPFSPDGARFLAGLGVPAFKIASSDVNYPELLEAVALLERPVVLSTGKSKPDEVRRAVDALRNAGCADLVVLHCVAQYPASLEEMNLRVIEWISAEFPGTVPGLSDHSQGVTAAAGAVAIGAKVVEKHLTLDRGRTGPDHWFSADPTEFRQLSEEVRKLEAALGTPEKRIVESERTERSTSTRSLVLARDLEAGATIGDEDLRALRPGTGIDPFRRSDVVGRRTNDSLEAGTVLKWHHLE